MVTIGKRSLGDNEPCFITFEAGPTFRDIDDAKKLIEESARAGADAVKFQILDPDFLVADRKLQFSYKTLVDRDTGESEQVSESLYEILKRRQLPESAWRELKKLADSLNIAFFATVDNNENLDLAIEIGCQSIKIASGDVNHFPLIREAARTGLCLQLDTGKSTIGEIERAVDVIRECGNENIIIHHCPSGYPARLDGINLNIIPTLKSLFEYPIAYSDHVPGWEMDVAAVALGANLLEKTITLDRTIRSPEHIMSIEPSEMKEFVDSIRNLEVAMGSKRRLLSEEEATHRLDVRRSLYLKEPAKKGTLLKDAVVEYRRPGFGIAPDEAEKLMDAVLSRDIEGGYLMTLADFN